MESAEKSHSIEGIRKDDRPLDPAWTIENLKKLTNDKISPDEMQYFIRIMHAFNVPFDEYIRYQRTRDMGGTPTLAIEAKYRAIRVERLTRKQENEFPEATAICAESLERDHRGNVRKFSFYPENQPFDPSQIVIHTDYWLGMSDEHLSPRQVDEKRIYQDFLLKNVRKNADDGYDLQRKGGIWHNISAGQDTKLRLPDELRKAANRLIKTSNEEIIDLSGDAEKVRLHLYQSAALQQLQRRVGIDEMEARHYANPRHGGKECFKPLATFAFMTEVLDTIARERSQNQPAALESSKTRGADDSPPASLFSNESASSYGSLPSWGKGVEGKVRPIRAVAPMPEEPKVYVPSDSHKSAGKNSETGGMPPPSKEERIHQVRVVKSQQQRQLIDELPTSLRQSFQAYVFSPELPTTKIAELKKALAGKPSAVPPIDNNELLECVLFCLENPPNEKLLQKTRQSMLQKEHQLAGTLSDSMRESFGAYVFSPESSATKIQELKKALAGKPSAVPPVNNNELLECVRFRLENPPPPPPPPHLRPPHLVRPPHLGQPPPPPPPHLRPPHLRPPFPSSRAPLPSNDTDSETHARTTASERFIQGLPESDLAMQRFLLEQITLNPSQAELVGKAGPSRDPGPPFARGKAQESAAEREATRKAMEVKELELGQQAGDQWPAFIDSPKMSPSEKIKEMEKALDGKSSAVPPVSPELLECAVFRLRHPRSRETSPAKSGRST